MHDWTAPPKPAEFTENRLITAILDGDFPIGSYLPGERDLAVQLGVTRPTLREALQRLARDGWVDIQHGKPTRVRDYWHEGNLGVLSAMARRPDNLPGTFVPNVLEVRQLLAPAYTRQATINNARKVVDVISRFTELADDRRSFAAFDWELHHNLTVLSGNPIFTLILNGFHELYLPTGKLYFSNPAARAHSRSFYKRLLAAAQAEDAAAAENITRQVMSESLELWQRAMQKLDAIK